MLELYIHIQRLNDLISGRAVNVKINYADQYDIKIMINPKKYLITLSNNSQNMLTIKKKRLIDYLLRKKNNI